MRNFGIIDANVLLRVFLNDIPEQTTASADTLDQMRRGLAVGTVLTTVVQEIVYILERQYRVERSFVASAIRGIADVPNLGIENRQQILDCLTDYELRPGISFSDAFHCAMARSFHDGAIVSFDRKLSSVPGIARREPGEFAKA